MLGLRRELPHFVLLAKNQVHIDPGTIIILLIG